jgi:hypothetical protein
VGSYVVPTSPAPPSDLLNGHVRPPSAQEQEIILEGWRELELLLKDQSNDCSMFSCGADAITALLLSKYYLYCGYDISTKDIVQHPSRSMQAYLLNLKKMGLENLLDSV